MRRVVFISCYELGRPPLTIARPAALCREAGIEVELVDLAVDRSGLDRTRGARLAALAVPMHTALRLGVAAVPRLRELSPGVHVHMFGLYALLNAAYLLAEGMADSVSGGETDGAMARLASGEDPRRVEGVVLKGGEGRPLLQRSRARPAALGALGGLDRYARLEWRGERRLAGAVESSRGCLHHCRHCPIPPVYGGRFFALDIDVVMEDVRALVEAGARHVTFADPDFLNGPTHALRVARRLARRFPGLTFDFTAKVEHLLRHADLVGRLRDLGCLFVISAVESFSDVVLDNLAKGHTRAGVLELFALFRSCRLALRPTFVSFTPWTTLDDYCEQLEILAAEDLVGNVDPVQLAVRLLVPPGSGLLGAGRIEPCLEPLAAADFHHPWRHPDRRMDELHGRVSTLVAEAASRGDDRAATFERVRAEAARASGRGRPQALVRAQEPAPRMTEDWFC